MSMSGMAGMSGMGLSRLTWSSFFGTWSFHFGWTVAAALLLVGYLAGIRSVGQAGDGRRSAVHPWRVGSFVAGVVLLWVTVSSAIGDYAMSVFWMHMVEHLLLIMVVPSLLVMGHPLTVLAEAVPGSRGVLRSWPVTVVTHHVTGIVLYTAVIIATHLTGFMNAMAMHTWLMTAEQALYVITGWIFLTPMLGEEPLRTNPPYLVRLVFLVAAMIPDTLVGIVLLQTNSDLFPMMFRMHPAWAPSAISDLHAAGGLMWAGGDGLMMVIAIGLMISVVTSPTRREKMTGRWLESARSQALAAHVAYAGAEMPEGPAGQDFDPDSDEALEAYNRMLARLHDRDA